MRKQRRKKTGNHQTESGPGEGKGKTKGTTTGETTRGGSQGMLGRGNQMPRTQNQKWRQSLVTSGKLSGKKGEEKKEGPQLKKKGTGQLIISAPSTKKKKEGLFTPEGQKREGNGERNAGQAGTTQHCVWRLVFGEKKKGLETPRRKEGVG